MDTTENTLTRFFTVFARGQTYLNLLYNLLAFPLGLFYFIVLVTGLSVGIGTVIIWIGLLILALTLGAWWLFILFERQLASGMLRVKLGTVDTPNTQSAQTIWKKLGAYLSNPVTWKGLLYLFLKFPLGLAVFVTVITFGSIALYLLTAPLTYTILPVEVSLTFTTYWRIDTLSDALIAMVASIPMIFITLHISNGLAWISGWLAKVLLGNPAGGATSAAVSSLQAEPTSTEGNPENAGEHPDEEKSPSAEPTTTE